MAESVDLLSSSLEVIYAVRCDFTQVALLLRRWGRTSKERNEAGKVDILSCNLIHIFTFTMHVVRS